MDLGDKTKIILILVGLALMVYLIIKTMLAIRNKKTDGGIMGILGAADSLPTVLKKVEAFDENAYVYEIFKAVFVSIGLVDDWSIDVGWDKILFKKKKSNSVNGVWKPDSSITLRVEYEFVGDIFTIKKVILTDELERRDFRCYSDKLSESEILIIYNAYSDSVDKSNEASKEVVDRSLLNIRNIIGKAADREDKLNKILG